jgi:hypothetical protein
MKAPGKCTAKEIAVLSRGILLLLALLGPPPAVLWAQNIPRAGRSPRMMVDVTAYGARGDGSDDTAAIQAAIDAACSAAPGGGGAVYFPQPRGGGNGFYAVTQTQVPSTAPIFDLRKCRGGVTMEGDAAVNGALLQFARNPMTRIVAVGGAHPNNAAVFFWSGNGPGPSFRSLSIEGWNRAMELQNGNNVTLSNVALAARNTQQGWGCAGSSPNADCSDNVALAIYNSIWIYADQLALVAPTTYGYPVHEARRVTGVITLETAPQDPVLGKGTKINLRNCAPAGDAGNLNGGPYTIQSSTATQINIQSPGDNGFCHGGTITSVEYGLLAAGIPASDGSTPGVSLVRMDKSFFAGGGLWYDQRAKTPGATGSFYLYNVDQEGNSQSPFLTVTATGQGLLQMFGPLHIVDSQAFDCSDQPFIRLDANRQARFDPIELVNSSGCANRGKGIIELLGGQLGEVSTDGVADAGIARFPVDGNGNILGNVSRNEKGFDLVVNTTDQGRLRTDIATRAGFGNSGDGAAIRMTAAGDTQASLALDPDGEHGGLLFGDGHEDGYDAALSHPNALAVDVNFAMALPPATAGAMAVTGGALPPGPYYFQVCAYTSARGMKLSTPSPEVMATLKKGETALRVTWTRAQGLEPEGYVVFVCAGRPGCEVGGGATAFVVAGAENTSLTVTTMQGSHGSAPVWNATLAPIHSFQGRRIGVNNNSPAAQLDVVQQDSRTAGFNLRATVAPQANPWQISDSNSKVRAKIDGEFNFAVAGHHNQFAANGDSAGIMTVESGSILRKRFLSPFHAVPACTVTPLADPGSMRWWITASPETLMVHLSEKSASAGHPSASGSLQFSYVCMGNPN